MHNKHFENQISTMLQRLQNVQESLVDVRDAHAVPEGFYDTVEAEIIEFLKSLYRMKELEKEAVVKEPFQAEKEVTEAVPSGFPEEKVPSGNKQEEEKQSPENIQKYFSLNDRFYFLREIFDNDADKMNETILALNNIFTFEESVKYITETLKWDMESPVNTEFLDFVEKRFSNILL